MSKVFVLRASFQLVHASSLKPRSSLELDMNDKDLTSIDTLRFDSRIPNSLDRSVLEDHCVNHDLGVYRYKETDGPKYTSELLARDHASEQKRSTDLDDADD